MQAAQGEVVKDKAKEAAYAPRPRHKFENMFVPAVPAWEPSDDFMEKMRKLASTGGVHGAVGPMGPAGLAYTYGSAGSALPASYTNAASLGSLLPKGTAGQ